MFAWLLSSTVRRSISLFRSASRFSVSPLETDTARRSDSIHLTLCIGAHTSAAPRPALPSPARPSCGASRGPIQQNAPSKLKTIANEYARHDGMSSARIQRDSHSLEQIIYSYLPSRGTNVLTGDGDASARMLRKSENNAQTLPLLAVVACSSWREQKRETKSEYVSICLCIGLFPPSPSPCLCSLFSRSAARPFRNCYTERFIASDCIRINK